MPTTSDLYPAAGGDDGYATSSAIDTTGVELVFGSGRRTFVLFKNIPIPLGAQVSLAWGGLTGYASWASSGDPCNLRTYLNAEDNPSAPTTKEEVNSLSLTTAYTEINAVPAWTAMSSRSLDIDVAVFNEIFSRPGWRYNNNLMVVVTNGTDGTQLRKFVSKDYGTSAPRIRISWELYGCYEEVSASDEFDAVVCPITEDVSVDDLYTGSDPGVLDEAITSDDLLEPSFPYRGEIDEAATANDEWDTNQCVIAEEASANDNPVSEDVECFLYEDVFVNSEFEEHPDYYDLDTTEDVYARDDWVCNNPCILDESATVSEALDTLLDGLDEAVTADDDIHPAYDASITETLSPTDLSKVLLCDTLTSGTVITDSINRWLVLLLTQKLNIYELAQPNWNKTITEALTPVDVVTKILGIPVPDWMGVSETLTNNWYGTHTVTDTAMIYDLPTLIKWWQETITESLVQADTVHLQLIMPILEVLTAKEVLTDTWVFGKSITDSLTAMDTITGGWMKSILEGLDFEDIISIIGAFNRNVEDEMWLADTPSSIATFYKGVTEQVIIADAIRQANLLSATSALTATDAATILSLFYGTISDTFALADAPVGINNIALSASESLLIYDSIASAASLYLTITETLDFGVSVELDNEIWECYVLNSHRFQPSIYTGFNFNSYCVYENRAFGANSTGIYELTGETDAGTDIHTGVVFPETHFDMPNRKRFRRAYLGISGSSPMMMMETEDGQIKAYSVQSDGEVEASRNMTGKKWTLSIADFDSLEFIKLIPVILAKGN